MEAKKRNKCSCIWPFIIGVASGLLAKLVDIPEITSTLPIFDNIFGRFGIWIWVATLISIFSKNAVFAAIRSFAFFGGMLSAYYGYTILFLGFFPKSQIVLWSIIALFTPLCGFLIWHIREKKRFANVLASLPLMIFFTEWYLTGKDNLPLLIAYLCMAFSFLMILPNKQKRLFSVVVAVPVATILVLLIQAGVIVNFYDRLLNI